jgi:hypothetical protein
MTIDWSNPTIQVAALGVIGIISAALLAGVFGAAAALVSSRAAASTSRDVAQAAAAAARLERAEAHQAKLDDIQRDTLLALQERLAEWMRAAGKAHVVDARTLRAGPGLTQGDPNVSEEEMMTGRRLMYLTERVRDDQLRKALSDLRAHAAGIEADKLALRDKLTLEWEDTKFNELVLEGDEVLEKLGVTLRTFL